MTEGLRYIEKFYDWFEHRWEGPLGQRSIGTSLVVIYIITIAVIELNRLELLPTPLNGYLPTNHLLGIEVAFNLLLLFEIISLVFSLAGSVARSAGKQFEVLSLILLRDTFKEFSHFHEPIIWAEVVPVLDNILATAIGALLIFVILGYYYRIQNHHPITKDDQEQIAFVRVKKLIALALLAGFVILSVTNLQHLLTIPGSEITVFEQFYTLLVFSDVLIVLISLRYSSSYHVAFRNSGFTVSTILIRLALIAPATITAILGVVAALFNLGVSLAYNLFVPPIEPDSETKAP